MCHHVIDEFDKWLTHEIVEPSNNEGGYNLRGVLVYVQTRLNLIRQKHADLAATDQYIKDTSKALWSGSEKSNED